MLKTCLVGEGGQGEAYMKALGPLSDIAVTAIVGGNEGDTNAFAERWNIPYASTNLEEALRRDDVDAAIIASPTGLHAEHARLAISHNKHVLLEIPMADNLADCEEIAALAESSPLVCMVAHTRRFQPMFRHVKHRVESGDLDVHHMVFQTYFFRRTNLNRDGNPRTWVDSLLWHHACHSVDTAKWLFGAEGMQCWAQAGPDHPELGIPMDITVGMKTGRGQLVTGALSFNNHGKIQVSTRFIGEQETLVVISNEVRLVDHEGNELVKDKFGSGLTEQVQEFVSAVAEQREPEASFADCLQTMRLLARLQDSIAA